MKRLLILLVALSACQTAPTETPAEASTATTGASVPALALTKAGEALTSSVLTDGGAKRLVVTHPNGTVVEVARGDVSDHSQSAPRLAVAPDGTVLVLYVVDVPVEGRRFPASDVFLARSRDGGRTFEAPVRVNPEARVPTGHTFADLAVGPGGEIVVSWLDGTASEAWKQAHPDQSASASPHALPVRLVHDGEEEPHHGASGHGGSANGDPGTTLVVARSVDGGQTFEAPVAVAPGTCPCCRTALDVGPRGAVRVVWRQVWPGGERDPAVATSTDGGKTFGAPVRVHADRWAIDGCPHAGPAVAEDTDGRVHVAWYTGADGRLGLWHAVSTDGGQTFGEPTALGRGAPLGQTRAVRDGTGRVWLAWEDRSDATVRTAPAAGGDTTRTDGLDPALVGTRNGVTLATVVDGAVRVASF